MTPEELFLRLDAWPVLALVPAIAVLLVVLDARRRRRVVSVLGPRAAQLSKRDGRSTPLSLIPRSPGARIAIVTLAWGMAVVAILQPAWGEKARTIEQRGVDLFLCLDLSRSMLARDESPSRLDRAKREIRALTERARGDRMGLVVFAGEARMVVPLTQDVDSLLDMVDLAEPHDIARGGTDLGAALDVVLGALAGGSGEHEAVILLTDGEDLEERGLRSAEAAAKRGIAVHCVGFGSDRGSKIPIEGASGEEFLRDRSGNEVISALDPASLRAIARETDGLFIRAIQVESPLVDLYESRILPMASKAFASEERRERANRFQWPLLIAVLLFLGDIAYGRRLA